MDLFQKLSFGFILLFLNLSFNFHAILGIGEDHINGATEESYASNKESESECMTQSGNPGQCNYLHECFPLLARSEQNPINLSATSLETSIETDLNSTLLSDSIGSLYEEISSNLNSKECNMSLDNSTELKVCCENSNETYYYSSNQDTIISLNENQSLRSVLSQLPESSCGYSNGQSKSFENNNKAVKITGGHNTNPGQFPFSVAIFGKNKKHTCGGSLITNDYIITAAHCMFTYTSSDLNHLTLNLGDHNIRSSNDGLHETRKISKIILHKNFNSKNYFNDIALLKMDRPVTFTEKIQPICLPDKDLQIKSVEGNQVIVMGWGKDRPRGQASDILKMVEIPVWKFEECQKVFNVFAPNRLKEWNICAGDGRRNKDACIGDSGGPLVYHIGSRWVQLGITSWGKGCGSFPGVYTSVLSFLPWIEKNLN